MVTISVGSMFAMVGWLCYVFKATNKVLVAYALTNQENTTNIKITQANTNDTILAQKEMCASINQLSVDVAKVLLIQKHDSERTTKLERKMEKLG